MEFDAWSRQHEVLMSSEERRKADAALLHALELSPDVGEPATQEALRAYVAVLVREGLLPEAAVIAFKETLSRTHSLQRYEAELREQKRAALISECIERFFATRTADDVRDPERPALRLVHEEHRAPRRPQLPDTR